ncbi:MAG: rhodanese-like domain-containing protein [Algoriphagus sp.]|nr:rhodanese-like domain-containing protein [Algoriphagus sp.]
MKRIIYLLALVLTVQSCSQKTEDKGSTSEAIDSQSQIENLDAASFKTKVDSGNGIILDVRTPGEVAQGYIANATIIDIYDQNFINQLSKLPKDQEVYVYCASGVRSVQAAEILHQNGFTKVYNLSEGLMDWQRSGYPLVK